MKTTTKLVQYYHPKKGGWYYAYLIKLGRKWARLETVTNNQRFRALAVDIKEVVDEL